jgi:hypothetical protein
MKRRWLVLAVGLLVVPLALTQSAFGYYHPALGRWLSRDPAGYVDGMNLYEYGGSQPSLRQDPRGMEALPGPAYPHETPSPRRDTSNDKVSLQVKRIAAGGSIEVFPDGGDKVTVDVAPGTDTGTYTESLMGDLLRAVRRWWHDVDTRMSLVEDSSGTFFYASLDVSVSADRPRSWQICPRYQWRITVRNICCASKNVRLTTSAMAGPYAQATVPESRIIPLDVNETEELIPDVVLALTLPAATGKGTFVAQEFESYSSVFLVISCEE